MLQEQRQIPRDSFSRGGGRGRSKNFSHNGLIVGCQRDPGRPREKTKPMFSPIEYRAWRVSQKKHAAVFHLRAEPPRESVAIMGSVLRKLAPMELAVDGGRCAGMRSIAAVRKAREEMGEEFKPKPIEHSPIMSGMWIFLSSSSLRNLLGFCAYPQAFRTPASTTRRRTASCPGTPP